MRRLKKSLCDGFKSHVGSAILCPRKRLCSVYVAVRLSKSRGLVVGLPLLRHFFQADNQIQCSVFTQRWERNKKRKYIYIFIYIQRERGRERHSERFIGCNESVAGVHVVVLWLWLVSIMDPMRQLTIDCTAHNLVRLLFFSLAVYQAATLR